MSETFKLKKIAILGGGMASLIAAYELTSQPGWDSLYEITIYQQGWRLGGKCASGRNVESHGPEQEPNYRIQEHGLHIFFGFYENIFRILKQCYDELGDNGPFETVEDAFNPHSLIVLEEYVNGHWLKLSFDFPRDQLVPWEGGGISSLWNHIRRMIKFVLQTFTETSYGKFQSRKTSFSQVPGWLDLLAQQLEIAWEAFELVSDGLLLYLPDRLIQSLLREPNHWWSWLDNTTQQIGNTSENVGFTFEGIFLQLAYHLAQLLPENTQTHRREHHNLILKLLDRFWERLSRRIEIDMEQDDDTAWRLTLIDLALTNIRGLFADEVLHYRSLAALDEYDYRDWLQRHGARQASVDSAFVRVLYDLVYAFPEGNIAKPQLAAGTAIRILMTLVFQYNGTIMWKMRAGMGDVVITPLYKVLKRRGVKFEFFHCVKKLHLDQDEKTIASITVERQVNLKNPNREYEPLINVKGLPCWPSEPLYDQIVDEEAEKLQRENIDLESFWTPWSNVKEITLNEDGDFDIVLLGISLAALPDICHDLIHAEKNPAQKKWSDMVKQIKTVSTQGGQLWLSRTLQQLGWQGSSPVVSAYVEPLDTYADMTDLLDQENWSSEHYPYNIAYFTGVIEDPGIPPSSEHGFPAQAQQKVEKQAIKFLENQIRNLWPDATTRENPQGINWDLLVDPEGRKGSERFNFQYWRVNIDPSERYVLSVPGSTKYRIKTDESGFINLYLVGDWINNGYNAGCVEATVISAMQAARAILQQYFQLKYPKEIIREWDSWI
ncbi:MAG: NAD(P)-binding protein [Chroococcidiopsidaceae cyanobacterium CP_BM_RX_35]|nr:NAD(P)-binding protein [Chroococcidiopsidaceae cyanobacterium CP_BM_RX_35]